MKKICIIVGTRPEIIKMSPIIKECREKKLDYFILHTGQHYSYSLDKIFFEELKLPIPKYNLDVGSGSHAEMTAKVLVGVEKTLTIEKPDIVLVEGDTNSVLGGTLAACKLHVKVGHIEAGLRSFDKSMPEEINRILTDHCSDYLFAPTQIAKKNLLKEGISDKKVSVTGNTIVDALAQNLKIAENSNVLEKLNLKEYEYLLVTLHRQENVDNRNRLRNILRGLQLISEEHDFPIIFPVHPHTMKTIKTFKYENLLESKHFIMTEPLGFMDFLKLESKSKLILTDSGGIQEETCILGIPCVTLRYNTERPETLEVGSNILAGYHPKKILANVNCMINKRNGWKNPFGDGNAGKRIISIVGGV